MLTMIETNKDGEVLGNINNNNGWIDVKTIKSGMDYEDFHDKWMVTRCACPCGTPHHCISTWNKYRDDWTLDITHIKFLPDGFMDFDEIENKVIRKENKNE